MTDEPADIVVAGVQKSFGNRTVLRGLDLDVPAGTITAVLGPSGCGKTTLLRILAGFEDPDAGTVRIGGRPVVDVPSHQRRVGLMPQEGALFPHLSVAANIVFGLKRAQRADSVAVVEHWLEMVGLVGLADARPHELSGGQQQRVALARALAAQPRVLLLDEPFAALDAGLRGRVREDIATILRDAGTTALLVTHDQAEALSLADSVALLMDGKLAQHGPPEELYRNPATLAAARFVGTTVELAGTVTDGVLRTALGILSTKLPVTDGDVVVALRPEQVRLTTGGPGRPATVTACRFYGAETTVHVVLLDGSTLSLRSVGGPAPAVGSSVTVEVDDGGQGVLAYPSPAAGQRMPLGESRG